MRKETVSMTAEDGDQIIDIFAAFVVRQKKKKRKKKKEKKDKEKAE